MDIEEIKLKWQQYDKELKAAKMLNEQIIKRMLRDKSDGTLGQLRTIEIFGVGFCSLLLVFLLLMMPKAGGTYIMVISYSLLLAATVVSLVMSTYKLRSLSQINFNDSVIDTTERIQRFRLFMAKERLWSVLLSPVFTAAAYIVLFQWLDHHSVFDNNGSIWRMLLAIVLVIVFALALYPKLYFSKINAIMHNLQDVTAFRQE